MCGADQEQERDRDHDHDDPVAALADPHDAMIKQNEISSVPT